MRIHSFGVLFALVAMLTACASNPGVAPIGPDTYLVTRQAATGFPGLGGLKTDALREADAFCKADGRVLNVVETTESKPPYLLGNYPRVEVQFKCLRQYDSRPAQGQPQ